LQIRPAGDLLSGIVSSPGDAFTFPSDPGASLCRPVNAAPAVFAGPDLGSRKTWNLYREWEPLL